MYFLLIMLSKYLFICFSFCRKSWCISSCVSMSMKPLISSGKILFLCFSFIGIVKGSDIGPDSLSITT